MYRLIESEGNKTIKLLSSLSQKKYRYKNKLFFVEGYKVIKESFDYYLPKYIIIDEKLLNNIEIKDLCKDERLINTEILIVNEKIFKKLSDTENSQGIIAYYKFIHREIEKNIPNGQYIYLDSITDPGNLGGIIRSAEGFGFTGIIIGKECVDVYNPKALRSTMASIFRINIYFSNNLEEIETLANDKFSLLASTLENSKSVYEINFNENVIVAIGNEARGVREEIINMAQETIHIPMEGAIDSLNANVAASIIMYEAFRQKRLKKWKK